MILPPRLMNELGRSANKTVKISTNLKCNVCAYTASCNRETLNRSYSDPNCQSGIETGDFRPIGWLSGKATPHCSIIRYHRTSRSHKDSGLNELFISFPFSQRCKALGYYLVYNP